MTVIQRFAAFALMAGVSAGAFAAPVPKEQLLIPPADATHYVVVSAAGQAWRPMGAGRFPTARLPRAIRSRFAAGSPRSTK